MVGSKPEHWRIITPAVVGLNIVATFFIGYLPTHVYERLERHLDQIDDRFDKIANKQEDFNVKLALLQGQCCKRSINQSVESLQNEGG